MIQNDFLAGVLSAGSKYEPIRTNNAVLRLDLSTLAASLGDLAGSAQETLKLALAGFSLPKNETSPVMVPYLNEVRKFAGQTMFDDISVSFHDYVDAQVAKTLWAWRYLIHDPKTGIRGLKTTYAVNGEIEHFAPDGGQSRIYKVQGCWPMNLDMGDIEMGADEPIRLQVRFACDKVYPADSGMLSGLNGAAFAGSNSV